MGTAVGYTPNYLYKAPVYEYYTLWAANEQLVQEQIDAMKKK